MSNVKCLAVRIALVHDWLLNIGGAERVLKELHNIFPTAPIWVLFYDRKFTDKFLPEATISASWLQKFPLIRKIYPYLFFLMPSAIESLDLSDYDLVISSSVIFSKGLILKPKTRHICYCYSPTRFLWDRNSEDERKGVLASLAKHVLRIWDRQASDRVDEFVAISENVRQRIQKYYRRDAKVIYPPAPNLNSTTIDQEQLTIDDSIKCQMSNVKCFYYLIVSRLYPHKNIKLAVKVFNKLKHELVIVGNGPLKNKLQKIASKNIKFPGHVSDEELAVYYQNCKALIMPQEEDFGLTQIEAMSLSKPVLALRRGGALETIREGITGEFFDDPIPEALADGIRRLNENYGNYSPEEIKKSVSQFSVENFRKQILNLIA